MYTKLTEPMSVALQVTQSFIFVTVPR